MALVKDELRRLVDSLPEDVTWDEVARRIFERRMIEAGRSDVAAGRYLATEELRARLGLDE